MSLLKLIHLHQVWPVIAAAAMLTGCKPLPQEQARTEPPEVVLPASVLELPPVEAVALMQSTPDLVILDVRTEAEIKKEGRIAGAQNYDYLHGEAMFERLEKLDRAKFFLIYCAIGGRSKLAAVRMTGMGFTNLAVIKGGLNAWVVARMPLTD